MGKRVKRVGFSWRIGSTKLSSTSSSDSRSGNLVDFAFITGELNADLEDLGDEIGFSISATILKPEKRDASILHHNLTQTPISILSFL
jgi:hypothetical protein